MVDCSNAGFLAAARRLDRFCQQLNAGSVYLQFILKFGVLNTAQLLNVAENFRR